MICIQDGGKMPNPYTHYIIKQNWFFRKQWFLSGGNFAYPGNSIIYFLCLNCATGDILSTSAQKGPYNDTTDDLTKNWKIPHISSQTDLNVDIHNLNKKSTELLQICKDVSGIASSFSGNKKIKLKEFDIYMDTKTHILHITQCGNWCTLEDVFFNLIQQNK